MSKKSKKKERNVTGKTKATVLAAEFPMNVVAAKAQPRDQFNPDYKPVIMDLKRIGGLAGFFIVVLIILSFFLR